MRCVSWVTGGGKRASPNLDEKITRVDQPAVAIRARAGQRCKLDLLTRTVDEAGPHGVEICSWGRILGVDHETQAGMLLET